MTGTYILGLDTSSRVSGTAVLRNGKVLAEVERDAKLAHSETIIESIDLAVTMAGIEKRELGAVSVTIGPGSFTGLRVGLAAAKALAYALNIPLLPVDTFKVLCANLPVSGINLLPTVDAQKKSAYSALCRWEKGELLTLREPRILSFDRIIDELEGITPPVIILGDVAEKLAKLDLPVGVTVAAGTHIMPRAASNAILGEKLLMAGKTGDPMTISPLYLRASEAEILWEKNHGN